MTLTAAQSNLELLKSGLFSDFTIECRGSEFKVHKAIICPCSDFFKAACNPNFEEGRSRRLALPEEDLESLTRCLIYLYTKKLDMGGYPEELQKLAPINETRSQLMTHAMIYLCADKLGLHSLTKTLMDRFKWMTLFETNAEDIAAVLENVYRDTVPRDEFRLAFTSEFVLSVFIHPAHDRVTFERTLEVHQSSLQLIEKHEPCAHKMVMSSYRFANETGFSVAYQSPSKRRRK